MGKCQESTGATAIVEGRLERTPKTSWCHAKRINISELKLAGIPITAYGTLAEQLSRIPPKTMLRITANLTMNRWQTGEGKPREHLQLIAKEIAVL